MANRKRILLFAFLVFGCCFVGCKQSQSSWRFRQSGPVFVRHLSSKSAKGKHGLEKTSAQKTKEVLSKYINRYKALESALARAYAQSFLSPDPRAMRNREKLEYDLYRLHRNPLRVKKLKKLSKEIREPVLSRQIQLALQEHDRYNGVIKKQFLELVKLETLLERRYLRYRPKLRGQEVSFLQLENTLAKKRSSKNLGLAWVAERKRGTEVRTLALKVVEKRNAMAVKAGFSDAFEQRLAAGGVDVDWLMKLVKTVEKTTQRVYEKYKSSLDEKLAKRYRVSQKNLQIWHYGSFRFDDLPFWYLPAQRVDGKAWNPVDLVKKTFQKSGFFPKKLLKSSDLAPKIGKSEGAYCARLNRRKEVRIFASLKRDMGSVEKLLHEVAHGVYFLNIDQSLPFLLREPAHLFISEGVAMLFEKVTSSVAWLKEVAGLSSNKALLFSRQKKYRRVFRELLFVRWSCLLVHFERELYKKPSQDLDKLWWRLVAKYQKIPRPSRILKGGWASEPYPLLALGYYQNYLLGELFAWQILDAYHRNQNSGAGLEALLRPQWGRFLKSKIFLKGSCLPWKTLVKNVTGHSLSEKAFLKHHRFMPLD